MIVVFLEHNIQAERKWINIAKSINLDKSHRVILQKDLNYLMNLQPKIAWLAKKELNIKEEGFGKNSY